LTFTRARSCACLLVSHRVRRCGPWSISASRWLMSRPAVPTPPRLPAGPPRRKRRYVRRLGRSHRIWRRGARGLYVARVSALSGEGRPHRGAGGAAGRQKPARGSRANPVCAIVGQRFAETTAQGGHPAPDAR
jgi:hypothetical protein